MMKFNSCMRDHVEPRPLFLNRKGGALSVRSVERMMKKYLVACGLNPELTPHSLRHSFATHMLNEGRSCGSYRNFWVMLRYRRLKFIHMFLLSD